MRESTVRLGLMPPLTGLVGMYGEEISHAGQIACDEVNESGGVLGRPLELVIKDDGSLPDSAVAAAVKLVDKHRCAAIIGNLLSNARIAVAYQVAEPRRVPYLNFSFYEGSILSHYFFHFAALPNQQIDRMIPYMRKLYGARMYFAGNNYEWPRGSIDAAKRALKLSGGRVVGEEYYPLGVSNGDIERLLEQVGDSGADVFVPYFAGADQVHLLTRFTEKGLKKRMAVVMGHYDEIMASRLPPEVREGFYSSNTYFMTLATPENSRYLARLSGRSGVSGVWPEGNGILTNFGEGAYLCVKAFAKAAEQSGSLNPEALVSALETIDVSGPQGIVQMDPVTHHARVNTYLSRCRADGSFTVIERFGAILPVLPERYRHLRISRQSVEEDIYLQSRMIAQMTESVLLIHAKDSAVVYTNPGAERMFGYGPGELAGKPFSSLFAGSDQYTAEVTAAIGGTLSKKGVWQGETENIARDGKRFWCAASASVFTHPKYGEVWMLLSKDITERKLAEEALRLSEERFRKLVKVAPIPLCYVSKGGVIHDFNDRFTQVFGFTHADIPTLEEWWPLAYPDTAYRGWVLDTWNSALQAAVEAGQDIRPVEYNVTCKNGDVRVMEISGVTLGDDFLATFIDLTSHKQTENKLQASSLYARSLIEASLDPLVTISTEGKVTDVNEATVRATGVAREVLIGSDFSDYFTEPELARAGYREVFAKGFVTDYPLTLRHVSGKVMEVLYNAGVYRNAQGEVEGVFAAARDITERKKAEREVMQLNLRNRLILDSAGEGIYGLDTNGCYTFVNPAASRLLGFTVDELIGRCSHAAIHHTKPDGSPYPQEECPVLAAYKQGEVHRGVDIYWRKDGSSFPVEFVSTPIRERGKITGAVVSFNDINERKRAEKELRAASQYARSLIEASLDPLVTISAEGKITDVNEATVRATGLSREVLVGSDFSDYFTEPDKARAAYREAFAKGFVTDYPLILRHVSGKVMEVLYNAAVYRNDKGEAVGVFAAARDITERKRAEQRNRYLAAIVDSSDDAIIGKSLDGIITSWNKGAERMYGYSESEVVGQSVSILMPPGHQGDFVYILDAIKAGKHLEHYETPRVKKDGAAIYVSLSTSPIREDGGGIIGAATVARDITGRKLLEREREQYFKFFRLSMDPMCIADPYGCFKQVNPAFVLLTGYEENELVAKPFLEFILPEDRQKTADEMKLQVAVRPSMNFENRYVCKEGRIIVLSWTAYYDHNDGVTYATARDITERKRAEQELSIYHGHLEELVRERTEKLEVANKDLEGFAYSVSHDLRVPLRAIDGFSRQILKCYEDKLDDEGRRYLNIVRDNAKRMGRLIDDILAFSRMGRLGISMSEVDMEGMVREVFEELKPGFAERELTLNIKPLPPCRGDSSMLRQVWQNLLGNAVKFTGPKAVALVEVGGYAEDGETVYYVKDNGAGFDMQYAEKLFGVFQRLHGIEEFEGTGIGLAIVKRIVIRHGGRVWADGKVDEGATFYFSLPN